MTTFFLFFFILIYSENSQAQNEESRVMLTAGLTWRSTAMNFFNLKSLRPSNIRIPSIYYYEISVQGVSLNIGLQYRLSHRLKLEYHPNLRYDHLRIDTEYIETRYVPKAINSTDSTFVDFYTSEEVKAFIVDHNFNFIFKGKKLDYGIGMTIVASGKLIEYNTSPTTTELFNIEFSTYNAFIVVPIKKVINLEIKALYIPSGFPYNRKEKYMMYSLRAFYKFNLKRKKKG